MFQCSSTIDEITKEMDDTVGDDINLKITHNLNILDLE